jgi:hypothetical protein
MTAQEQQMIDGLMQRIRSTQVQDKDLDAERYLQQGLAGSPDALYILAQTVLVQQYGLQQAQSQIQEMQAALDEVRQHAQQSGGGGFLSKIFGGGSGQQQPQAPYQPVNNAGYPPQGYPPPGYGAPGYGPVYGQPVGYGGGGGFLRGAMQTAAGVAMGEMAFESMESLFHGFGGGGGYGHERPGESVTNNYYDDAGQHEHRVDDSNFYNPTNDASRQDLGGQDVGGDAGQNFADSGSADGGGDAGGFGGDSSDFVDNSGFDDSGSDDSGSGFDDGGGGDGSF